MVLNHIVTNNISVGAVLIFLFVIVVFVVVDCDITVIIIFQSFLS